MTTEPSISRPSARSIRTPGGFTLTELLIVMAIIVLALLMAVPAIRALTGSKSEAAAQNTISAFLARARTDAIGLQHVQGVLFYIDRANDRVTCVEVQETAPDLFPASPDVAAISTGSSLLPVTYLDVAPDHDTMTLPPGVRLQTLKEALAAFSRSSTAPFASPIDEQFLGYDSVYFPTAGPNSPLIGGVILFDGEGRTTVRCYGFKVRNFVTNQLTGLGQLLFPPASSVMPNADWPHKATRITQVVRSQIGFVLFDRETFIQQFSTQADQDGQPNEQEKENWIASNATPIFVNRYTGTLTRAE